MMLNLKKLSDSLGEKYPDISGICKNDAYAKLLQEDLAGKDSELTAVTQYLYQAFVAEPYEKEIYHALEMVSMVEMHHYELLSKMIVALGRNPVLRARETFWKSDNVCYTDNLYQMMLTNIANERQAIEAYRRNLCEINDPVIQKVLETIIADETIHIEVFEEILNAYCKRG